MIAGNCCCQERPNGGVPLKDPGFENHASAVGRNDIPFTTAGGGLHFVDTFPAPGDVTTGVTRTGWCSVQGQNQEWIVATDNVDGGARAAKCITVAGTSAKILRAVHMMTCLKWSTDHVPVSAIITPGQLITFSVRAKLSTGAGSARCRLLPLIQAGGLPGAGAGLYNGTTVTLSSSYQTLSVSVIAPAGSFYLRAEVEPITVSGGDVMHVDSASLTLS